MIKLVAFTKTLLLIVVSCRVLPSSLNYSRLRFVHGY